MVVPAVGIIERDNDCGVLPELRLLDRVYRVHYELLFEQRIGVARMTIHIGRRLEEAHGWKVVGSKRVEKVVNVILMVGPGIRSSAVLARRNVGTRMSRILGAGPVLEKSMMRDVI